ncbi:MAG: universal stress protein [Chloroflexota bacterium]
MYKRILLTLDRSSLAEMPIDYAIWLAKKSGAELTIMHVCGPEDCACEPGKCQVIPEAQRYVEQKAASIALTGGIKQVKPHIVAGDPATEILRYVDEHDVDLIIMATHGRSGVDRWLVGSVADKVVRNSNHPVRLVRPFASAEKKDETPDKTVLVLLDGSEVAEKILPYAAYHARLSNGELILLSVCEPPEIMHPVSYNLIPDSYPRKRPVQWYKYVEQETKRRQKQCQLYLDKLSEGTKEKEFKVRFESLSGDPAVEITKFLENNKISLIAMTTRGRSGVSRWVLGSIAETVLLTTSSPVLVLRPA